MAVGLRIDMDGKLRRLYSDILDVDPMDPAGQKKHHTEDSGPLCGFSIEAQSGWRGVSALRLPVQLP